MPESDASLVVIVLIVAVATFTLYAWWLSARVTRHTRALIAFLKNNEPAFWSSYPWLSRNLNPVGIIEAYHQSHQMTDPRFQALYQSKKQASRAEIAIIITAMAILGIILMGTAFWGWQW
jgi:hypothetical protein